MSGAEGATQYAERLKACSEVFATNVRETNARRAILAKIASDDYTALCRYGNEIGQPGLQASLDRILASPVCDPSDPVVAAVVKAQRTILQSNRKAIANDCRRAGVKSSPDRCGLTQGENLAVSCANEGGTKSCYCIPLTNTCTRESKIKIRQSYKVSADGNGRSALVEPGETNYDTCTTNMGSVITLGVTRSSKY